MKESLVEKREGALSPPKDVTRVDSSTRIRFAYHPELDALRFLAFMGVFMDHTTAGAPVAGFTSHHVPYIFAWAIVSFSRGGAYGVDLFFCLSAYLISALLLEERKQTGSLNLKSFYLRRILRIWPVYYLVILVAALYSLFDRSQQFGSEYFVPFVLFVGNWSCVLLGWPHSIVSPLWSVSVEEQFYLLWPPLAARLTSRQILKVAAGLVVVATLTRVWCVLHQHSTTQQIWGNTFAHLDALGAGIALGVLFTDTAPRLTPQVRITLIVFGLGSFMMQGGNMTLQPGELATLKIVLIGSSAVTIGCVAILIGFLGFPLRSPLAQYLGKISYGLYAYHFLCVYIVTSLLLEWGIGGLTYWFVRVGASLSLTVAVSAISYQLLEKPFLRLKKRFTIIESRAV